MPISIYRITPNGQKKDEVAWLCGDCWRLPEQGEALAVWLAVNANTLWPSEYVADIGFAPRADALCGGAAFSPETLRAMADVRMALFLSEYPDDGAPFRSTA